MTDTMPPSADSDAEELLPITIRTPEMEMAELGEDVGVRRIVHSKGLQDPEGAIPVTGLHGAHGREKPPGGCTSAAPTRGRGGFLDA